MRATWNKPLIFAQLKNVDVMVGGQIAEASTHHVGKFAKENGIRFVLNSTENVTVPSKFDMFITYNTSELNDSVIDLQSIATIDVYQYILDHPDIKVENKKKYKFLGFPRLDLVTNELFRNIEREPFKKKYQLNGSGKVYLFISSFLLDGAYDGIPQRDLDRWNIVELKKMTDHLLQVTTDILKRLLNEVLNENDVLLIKRHPWDCSSYFKDNFQSDRCIVLDKNDYILPCIVNSDFILHTYSTSAIEAWILNKKTISILLPEYKSASTLNHMKHEMSVSSFEELKLLLSTYPDTNPSIESLNIFYPNLDGMATLRLVQEIDKLKPATGKTVFKFGLKRRAKAQFREWLYANGLLKFDLKAVKQNSKMHDFYYWENNKGEVVKRFDKHFRKYVRNLIHSKGLDNHN
jgi:surface carbohydrate biosynthesis protein